MENNNKKTLINFYTILGEGEFKKIPEAAINREIAQFAIRFIADNMVYYILDMCIYCFDL